MLILFCLFPGSCKFLMVESILKHVVNVIFKRFQNMHLFEHRTFLTLFTTKQTILNYMEIFHFSYRTHSPKANISIFYHEQNKSGTNLLILTL